MQTVRAPMHVISQQDRDQHQQTTTRKNKTKHVKLKFLYYNTLSKSLPRRDGVFFRDCGGPHLSNLFRRVIEVIISETVSYLICQLSPADSYFQLILLVWLCYHLYLESSFYLKSHLPKLFLSQGKKNQLFS